MGVWSMDGWMDGQAPSFLPSHHSVWGVFTNTHIHKPSLPSTHHPPTHKQNTQNSPHSYEDGTVEDPTTGHSVDQGSLELLHNEEPRLRPGDTTWEIHARVTALTRDHGRKKFALWVDVSPFEQKEHGLCAGAVLTPPFRVVLKDGSVKNNSNNGNSNGNGAGSAAGAPPPPLPTRESSKRRRNGGGGDGGGDGGDGGVSVASSSSSVVSRQQQRRRR